MALDATRSPVRRIDAGGGVGSRTATGSVGSVVAAGSGRVSSSVELVNECAKRRVVGPAERRSESADVIVVGAGPGGSATAAYLAGHGLDVALLEKATFPGQDLR